MARSTKKTKDLLILPDGMGLYYIGFDGGGEVPAVLSGKYNSKVFAQAAINSYLTNRG